MLRRCLLFFTLSVFCGACLGFLITTVGAEDFSYTWPVEKSRRLSSLFADHRSFHFHSGIDIRTDGKVGYKVFACESGCVFRLFTSFWGYGKAIYLKLDDGRYALYGHLSNFAEKISRVVEKEQLEKRRYFTDFLLEKDQLRVEKGELIGYSGQSGLGGPHLHFEIRDQENRPINPLTIGFSIEDKLPPIMRYLAIRPLDIGSKVDGSHHPLIFSCGYDSRKKTCSLKNAPIVEGRVGLGLSVFDKMDNSRFGFGVLGIKLFLDESLIFASHYDTVSFESTRRIELDRDFELRRTEGKRFYKLYVDEGNDLPLYDPGGGIIDTKNFGPGPHQMKIIAYDANGNSSTLTFELIFDQSPLILSARTEKGEGDLKIETEFYDPDDLVQKVIFEKSSLHKILWRKISEAEVKRSEGRSSLAWPEELNDPVLIRAKAEDTFGAASDYKYVLLNADHTKTPADLGGENETRLDFDYSFRDNFFVFTLEFNQILKDEPQIMLHSGDFDFDPFWLVQTDEKSYWVVFPFYLKEQKQMTLVVNAQNIYGDSLRTEQMLPLSIVTKSYGGKAKNEDGKAEVKVDPDVVYKDMNLSVKKAKIERKSRHKVVGEIYSVEPSTVPLNGFAKISLKYSEEDCDPEKLGLYELTEGGWWRSVGQDLDTTNKMVSGKVRYFSTYALLEDTKAPTIRRIAPYDGKKLRTRKPQIEAVVGDDLSGIGSDMDVQITIDGEWMIPEYDPETGVLVTKPNLPLSYGKHDLLISVKDRAGNKSEVRRHFFVLKQE